MQISFWQKNKLTDLQMKRILSTTLFLFSAVVLMAEGYQVNVQSQRQIGMGHTGVAQKLGAASIHFNPGAMALMSGKYDFSFGATAVISTHTFKNDIGGVKSENENTVGTPFYFYGATQISDKLVAGIGITSPFGNSLKWGNEWQGRYLIQDIALQAIFVSPTLSYRLTDKLSIGAGFVMAFGGVDLNKGINLTPFNPALPDGQVNIKGNTTSYGYTAGLFYQVSDKLSAGLSYRSKVLLEMEDGDAKFTVPEAVSTYFPEDNKFSAELPLPSNLTLGLGWQANDKWFFALDLQYVGWSAYESLDFDFKVEPIIQLDSKNKRNFDNTMIYRLGVSYTPSSSVVLRTGIYFDETPIPDDYLTPETPGANKTGISVGCSWFITKKISIDASLLYIEGEKREAGYIDYPSAQNPIGFYGTYKTIAWLPGIGLSYSF